jgi:two-component system sensor kinase FixL
MNTLYRKTLITFSIVIAGVCASLFYIIYGQARNAAIAEINAEQMVSAKQADRAIEDFFALWTQRLNALSKMGEVVGNDDSGKQLIKLFCEANQGGIMQITRLNERGIILYDFPASHEAGADLSNQKYVRELLRDHKPVISDIIKSVEGAEAVALLVPVFRGSEFKGSVGILIDIENLAKRNLDVIKIGKTGYAWMISRDGTILYDPMPGFTGKSVFEVIKESPSLKVMVNGMVKGQEGTAQYTGNTDGDRSGAQIREYGVYMPVHFGNTFWSISVVSSEPDVLASLNTFRDKLAMAIGALFICGMVLSTLGAKAWLIVKEEDRCKLIEVKLRESEVRFRNVADTAPVMIWMSGTDKLCNFFSKGWIDFTGRSLEQELGNGWADGVHPDDLARCLKDYVESFDARRAFTIEYRLRRHDGEYRWISDNGVPRFDSGKNFLGYIGSCVDLTERRRAEERFRLVVEASPSGIVLVNGEGRIVLVNSTTEKLFGYSREELVGFAVEMLVPERFRGAHPGRRTDFFTAPQPPAMGAGRELFARRKDGMEFPVEIGLSPIQSAEEVLVLTVIVDITARKRAEAETQRQRAELTHVVRVSTVGALASSLAHELNQPLSAILSNAQAGSRFLAARTPNLAEVRNALEDIAQDTKRAGEVIRQVRALVRRGEPNLMPLDINHVIQDVVRLLHSDLLIRKVHMTLELDRALSRASGDSVQLQQVILNLVLNSFDAMNNMPEDRRMTIVRTRQLDTEMIRIEVRDFGTGIDPERMAKLFEPFRSSKREGLGLGLSISRSIVDAHKGRLWAENNSDQGATFFFTLPAYGIELNLR